MYYKCYLGIILATLLISVVTCRERTPIDIWEPLPGEKYEILTAGLTYSPTLGRIFFVRFKTINTDNPEVRSRHFEILYSYIGRQFNLDKYDYVILEAVPKGDITFGCQKTTVYQDKKAVREVIESIDDL
jgi:hypothetical protein